MKAFSQSKKNYGKLEKYQNKIDKARSYNSKNWVKNKVVGRYKQYRANRYQAKKDSILGKARKSTPGKLQTKVFQRMQKG